MSAPNGRPEGRSKESGAAQRRTVATPSRERRGERERP